MRKCVFYKIVCLQSSLINVFIDKSGIVLVKDTLIVDVNLQIVINTCV